MNISDAQMTFRKALVGGTIYNQEGFAFIKQKGLFKKDPFVLAEIAGVMSAKSISQYLPFRQSINLDQVSLYFFENDHFLNVYGYIQAYAKFDLDLEALGAVQGALLSLYETTKSLDAGSSFSNIRVIFRQNGMQIPWINNEGLPQEIEHIVGQSIHKKNFFGINVSVLKISDRGSKGIYEDGEKLKDLLTQKLKDLGMNVITYHIIPNEPDQICSNILSLIEKYSPQLIITTGGTGISNRDTTPESISKICHRMIPGLSELLRLEGSKYNSYSWLSRSIAGMIEDTMIITLPGKPNAVHESMAILNDVLPHALETLSCKNHDHI